jgi:hypothetical protein
MLYPVELQVRLTSMIDGGRLTVNGGPILIRAVEFPDGSGAAQNDTRAFRRVVEPNHDRN